jgi:ribosomal protein S18 acetylase RimI-like enzyme
MKGHVIRYYEELAANAWPSLQSIVYDGWILRFAKGYTKRANSVLPFYPSQRPLGEKIEQCERYYHRHGLPTIFKLTDMTEPAGLDAELERRDYALIDRVSVQGRTLDSLPKPVHGEIRLSPVLTDEWLDHFLNLNPGHREHRETIVEMFGRHVLPCCFATLQQGDRTVACGLAIMQDGKVGLYDIVTDVQLRGQGFAGSLILHLLHWAKAKGAEKAYLQVVVENAPALRLYEKLGFQELYQQWYRVKHGHFQKAGIIPACAEK